MTIIDFSAATVPLAIAFMALLGLAAGGIAACLDPAELAGHRQAAADRRSTDANRPVWLRGAPTVAASRSVDGARARPHAGGGGREHVPGPRPGDAPQPRDHRDLARRAHADAAIAAGHLRHQHGHVAYEFLNVGGRKMSTSRGTGVSMNLNCPLPLLVLERSAYWFSMRGPRKWRIYSAPPNFVVHRMAP